MPSTDRVSEMPQHLHNLILKHKRLLLVFIVLLGLALRLRGLAQAGFNEDEVQKVVAAHSYLHGQFFENLEHPMLMKLSGFFAWFLWRGIYLSKLPTLSRKLEVAIGWACAIPFPPNIVQLRPTPNRPPDAAA